MLVNNDFLYVSLPRCASFSFHQSCIIQKIKVKTINDVKYDINKNLNLSDIDSLLYNLNHTHESVTALKEHFGYNFQIISVRRNRHDRFISFWKHILYIIKNQYSIKLYNRLKKINTDELLFYTTNSVSKSSMVKELVIEFYRLHIKEYKPIFSEDLNSVISNLEIYLTNMFMILFSPISIWHRHDPSIIWFDFDKLYELENWVSNKLNLEFKLSKINSNMDVECNIHVDDYFKKKYNSIYDVYDLPKSKISLI